MPNPPDRLVTIGCPVDVLHNKFLGLSIGGLKAHAPKFRWTNFYRESDFIGGPVSAGIVNNHKVDTNFALSHYSYYAEPEVVGFLLGKTGSQVRAVAKRDDI